MYSLLIIKNRSFFQRRNHWYMLSRSRIWTRHDIPDFFRHRYGLE